MQWLVAEVIREIGTNTECQLASPAKLPIQLNRSGHGQCITKYQRLGQWVDAIFCVMREHPLAPLKRVSAVVSRTVEQLTKIQIEVAQECVHPVYITQRDSQIAAVFLGPGLKTIDLTVTQARTQSLTGLQVFVRHGTQGRQSEFHGEQNIAGSGQFSRQSGRAARLLVRSHMHRQHPQNLLMP